MTDLIPRAELEDMLDMYRDYPGAVLWAQSAVSIIEELLQARARILELEGLLSNERCDTTFWRGKALKKENDLC